MKNLKLSLGMLLFSILASNTVNAQDAPKVSQDKRQEIMDQMTKNRERLALREDQKVSFREISKKYAEQLREVRTSSLDRAQKFEKIKEIQTNKNAEMKTLLSEPQFKVYLEMQDERKAKVMSQKQ
jgi:cytochrome c556